MIITGLSPARSPPTSRRRKSASGFQLPDPVGAPDPPVAASVVEGASLLALQEQATPLARDGVDRDRAARRWCAALLDGLTRLQRALLRGSAGEAVADLARIASEPVDAADPGLRGAVAMTRLCVRIELARHNRS